MQFKHPELLWALFLLLIPIFIHLFQLRRFKKTPFTNVKFLQKVISESRRSNSLKKWLLLVTRMVLLAALVIAFAQPFFANESALKEKETVIYLDDSFSMQAKTDNTTLLTNAVQNLLKVIPQGYTFSLFTNTKTFKDVSKKDIQNDLLMLDYTDEQLRLNDIQLKAKTLFSDNQGTLKNTIILSDFQQRMSDNALDSIKNTQNHLVQLSADKVKNVVIDSVYIKSTNTENIDLVAILSTNEVIETIPVSVFNDEKLIAKTAAKFNTNQKAEVTFTIRANEAIKGRIEISDSGLLYDNKLYFNIDKKEKINVLAIGDVDSEYLKRIYTDDEFQFSSYSLKNLNYSSIERQNLIILNELNNIPNALITSLNSFTKNGGNLTLIPGKNIDSNSYNLLSVNYFSTTYLQKQQTKSNITSISFSHPLYENVFEKNVTNFQYPSVNEYYKVKSNASNILSLQDNAPFLIGNDKIFLFTASLSAENSNYKNSPLIVPTFYNMGINSLKLPKLYTNLTSSSTVDIALKLSDDAILKLAKDDHEFIPQQQSYANKVSLTFDENPKNDGIYSVLHENKAVKNISFNYNRKESNLKYIDLSDIDTKKASISAVFEEIEKDNTINELWKWFIIATLFFIVIEVLIQKYLS